MYKKIINDIGKAGLTVQYNLVGSRVTCFPPPTDTDLDVLILADEAQLQDVIRVIVESGFNLDCPSEHYRPEFNTFNSWRKGDINVILTASEVFYDNFLLASSIALELNLTEKIDRIRLFQGVLYRKYLPDFYSQEEVVKSLSEEAVQDAQT